MENNIELYNAIADFSKIDYSDFINVRLSIFSCIEDLHKYNDSNEDADVIFSLWIEFGKDQDEDKEYKKRIMVDVPLDELELFASSVLKHIEIIRRDYGEQIKKQLDRGNQI